VNYFPSRFDPVRHSEKVPTPAHQLSGRREKVWIHLTSCCVMPAFCALCPENSWGKCSILVMWCTWEERIIKGITVTDSRLLVLRWVMFKMISEWCTFIGVNRVLLISYRAFFKAWCATYMCVMSLQVMIAKENNFSQPGARFRSFDPDRYTFNTRLVRFHL
jgi:hypothetical protein